MFRKIFTTQNYDKNHKSVGQRFKDDCQKNAAFKSLGQRLKNIYVIT